MSQQLRELRIGKKNKFGVLSAFSGILLTLFFKFDIFSQDPLFFEFADQRNFLGLNNFFNTLSLLPILFVGLYGLLVTIKFRSNSEKFIHSYETHPFYIFFIGCLFFSLGSAFFHLNPSMETLLLARLPLVIIVASIFSIFFIEYLDLEMGWALMPVFLIAGLGSVFYWFGTEISGEGDLRLFTFVTSIPFVFIILIFLWGPPRYLGSGLFIGSVVFYGFFKAFESLDFQIWEFTGKAISGRTLSYLALALSFFTFIRYVKNRVALPQTEENKNE